MRIVYFSASELDKDEKSVLPWMPTESENADGTLVDFSDRLHARPRSSP